MPNSRPFGSSMSPQQAVVKASVELAPSYRPGLPGQTMQMESQDPELPDITIGLRKERRMFSRSWPLVIESHLEGSGPEQPLKLRYRRRPFRRPQGLEAVGAGPPADGAEWARRFEEASLLEGASEMTSVQDLSVAWSPPDGRWHLRLQTLAGSMIGTAPGSSIAVPFEPDDIRGLLKVLRAFRQAVSTRP